MLTSIRPLVAEILENSLVKKSFWDIGGEIFILSDIFHLVGNKDLKDVINIFILSSMSVWHHCNQHYLTFKMIFQHVFAVNSPDQSHLPNSGNPCIFITGL